MISSSAWAHYDDTMPAIEHRVTVIHGFKNDGGNLFLKPRAHFVAGELLSGAHQAPPSADINPKFATSAQIRSG